MSTPKKIAHRHEIKDRALAKALKGSSVPKSTLSNAMKKIDSSLEMLVQNLKE